MPNQGAASYQLILGLWLPAQEWQRQEGAQSTYDLNKKRKRYHRSRPVG